jgi:hypothetical protein
MAMILRSLVACLGLSATIVPSAVYAAVPAWMKANPAPLTKWLDGATPIDGKPGLDADWVADTTKAGIRSK